MTIFCKKTHTKAVFITYLIAIFMLLVSPVVLEGLAGGGSQALFEIFDDRVQNKTSALIAVGITYFVVTIIFARAIKKPFRKIKFTEGEIVLYFFILPPFQFQYACKLTKHSYNIRRSSLEEKITVELVNIGEDFEISSSDLEGNDWIFVKAALEQKAVRVTTNKYS